MGNTIFCGLDDVKKPLTTTQTETAGGSTRRPDETHDDGAPIPHASAGDLRGLAVCLAMAGVYGVLAYVVAQRSSEIGLRMALGANRRDVVQLVVRQGLGLATAGLALGLTCSLSVAKVLGGFLYDVRPGDPLTCAAVVVFLGLATIAASYLPARGAAGIDPLVALRQD